LIFPTLFLLALPPLFFCMRATRKITKRTRVAFPEQWKTLNRGMELHLFFYDERTFGDAMIAEWKRDLRWWMRAGMAGIALFPLTLLVIERLSK
jgi:hypothetical protein